LLYRFRSYSLQSARGQLVPIMSLGPHAAVGHKPIALVGGGTGLVGDPSGKTEMRKLLTEEDVAANVEGLKKQLEPFYPLFRWMLRMMAKTMPNG
jgi:tyrosyl-tRNA synthetase